jgi:hypothetical protein
MQRGMRLEEHALSNIEMELSRVERERWLPLLPDPNALQARAQPSPRTRAVPGKPPRLSCSKKPVTRNVGLRLAVKRKSAEEEGKRHSAAPNDLVWYGFAMKAVAI